MQRHQPRREQRAAPGDDPLQPHSHHAGDSAGHREPHRHDCHGHLQDRILMTFLKGNAKYPRFQRGQAIVLIAIMLAVVVGMAALAIDGSRAYALRRDLQAAADAAALAAGDSLQQTGSYILAEQAATASFGGNVRLYSSPSCSPGYGSPGATPRTITCTYSDGTVLKQVVSAL